MADNAGPMLIRARLITQTQLHAAYASQGDAGGTVIEALVAAGALDEEQLCRFFRECLLVPRVIRQDLERVRPEVVARVPADIAEEFRVVPYDFDREGNLILAMADPSDTHAVDELAYVIGSQVLRAVAAPSDVAWALARYYGIATPLAPTVAAAARTRRPPPGRTPIDPGHEDATPLPAPVPLGETTGSIPLLSHADLGLIPPPPAATAPIGSPESDAALARALAALASAHDRDAVANALVAYLGKLCRRAVFFVVKKGELVGWIGTGVGVRDAALRAAVLTLDRPSTFRDVVRTRLPYRGPATDVASRDFIIDGLGWAPADMLAVPIVVRERVVSILYGDERLLPIPDEHLLVLARAAQPPLERALAARRDRV